MFNLVARSLVEPDFLATNLITAADDSDDLFDLIVAIDDYVGVYEFSERLFQHFKPIHKAYKAHVKEDNL